MSIPGGLSSDLKSTVRGLGRRAGFTWAAVATLGLAVGGMTAMLTVANAILFRALPYPDAERLVSLCERHPQVEGFCVASVPNVTDWARTGRTIVAAGVAREWPMTLTDGPRGVSVRGGLATTGVFQALGVGPALGRLPSQEDERDGSRHVALVSHRFWQERLGGDAAAVGQTVRLEDSLYRVIGVLPAGFQVPMLDGVEVWTPVPFSPEDEEQRGWRGFRAIGRLAPGASVTAAADELRAIQLRLGETHPATNAGWGVEVRTLRSAVVGQVRPALLAFLGATLLAVLIACLNVATLLLARWNARQREMAVRSALGGGRWALVRLLLLETLLLAVLGAGIGLLLGPWATRAFVSLAPASIPRLDQVRVDPAMLATAFGIAILVPMLVALFPVLGSSRASLAGTLRTGGGDQPQGGVLARRLLVVAQLSLAVMLLTGAGLLGRSFLRLTQWSPGFERDHLVTLWTYLPPARFARPADVIAAYRGMRAEVSSLPGVVAVSQASAGPLFGGRETDGFVDAARPAAEPVTARWYDVGPDYFQVLGLGVGRGRSLTVEDRSGGAGVVVVNQTLARRMWPGREALGQQIRDKRGGDPMRVVGVVEDIPPFRAGEPPEAEVYWPFEQRTRWASYLVIRTATAPEEVGRLAASRLAERFPEVQVSPPRTIPELVQRQLVSPRFALLLIGAFALVALLISAIGVFGVVNFLVTRRSRELGIRLALGAEGRRMMQGVMAEGLRLAAAGAIAGVAGALALGRLIASLLAGVPPNDPVTLGMVALVLILVALLATWLPARRAARTDPMVVLRAE